MSAAARFLAAHRSLAAHGVNLDCHDLDLDQVEAIAAIADRAVSPEIVASQIVRAA